VSLLPPLLPCLCRRVLSLANAFPEDAAGSVSDEDEERNSERAENSFYKRFPWHDPSLSKMQKEKLYRQQKNEIHRSSSFLSSFPASSSSSSSQTMAWRTPSSSSGLQNGTLQNSTQSRATFIGKGKRKKQSKPGNAPRTVQGMRFYFKTT